jgi:hypothetical protein
VTVMIKTTWSVTIPVSLKSEPMLVVTLNDDGEDRLLRIPLYDTEGTAEFSLDPKFAWCQSPPLAENYFTVAVVGYGKKPFSITLVPQASGTVEADMPLTLADLIKIASDAKIPPEKCILLNHEECATGDPQLDFFLKAIVQRGKKVLNLEDYHEEIPFAISLEKHHW